MNTHGIRALLSAWKPFHATPRMPRNLFWPGYLLLLVVGACVGWNLIAVPAYGAIYALAVWTLLFFLLLTPATLRRLRDAGVNAFFAVILLLPVVFIAVVALFVPAVLMDGNHDASASAVYVVVVTYPLCLLPLTVFALLPTKGRTL